MFWSAFVFGLLGSFHCIGMCGPIAFVLPVDNSRSLKKIFQVFTYHLGRLLTYSGIGIVFGLIGRSFFIFNLQQELSIVIGSIMILLTLLPYHKWLKHTSPSLGHRFVSKVKSMLGRFLKKKSPTTFLFIGILNGFLPCGLVYMAVLSSMTANGLLEGMLYMVFFGLGTIPLMSAAVYIGNFLNLKIRQSIRKALPVFVIIIGILFIFRGLGLGIPYLSPMITPLNDVICH